MKQVSILLQDSSILVAFSSTKIYVVVISSHYLGRPCSSLEISPFSLRRPITTVFLGVTQMVLEASNQGSHSCFFLSFFVLLPFF